MQVYFVTLYPSFKGKRTSNIPAVEHAGIRGESKEDVRQYLEKEGIKGILDCRPEYRGQTLEIETILDFQEMKSVREQEKTLVK